MRLGLIACSKLKAASGRPSSLLYQGALFKKSMVLAKRTCDQIAILSAKYGLLDLNQIIEPYDETLSRMPKKAREDWARKVTYQLDEQYPTAHLIYYAGSDYYQGLPKGKYPFGNRTLGQRLQWLNQQIEGKGFL